MTGTALISTFDALLSDLDGVVYAGHQCCSKGDRKVF